MITCQSVHAIYDGVRAKMSRKLTKAGSTFYLKQIPLSTKKYIYIFSFYITSQNWDKSLVILPVYFLVGHNISVKGRDKYIRRKVYSYKYRKYNLVWKLQHRLSHTQWLVWTAADSRVISDK